MAESIIRLDQRQEAVTTGRLHNKKTTVSNVTILGTSIGTDHERLTDWLKRTGHEVSSTAPTDGWSFRAVEVRPPLGELVEVSEFYDACLRAGLCGGESNPNNPVTLVLGVGQLGLKGKPQILAKG